ncbi:hypothetical protein DPMN_169935 [Dreissena polymorpha]|uniref:Uncharacterized protein n=3 Tax=Dreissena polymorpha TaxID=45954 RepID=A0A9D4DWY2_DREPO|nr:hypothetical protein DPMN_169935 [Dreissena polymorpha]
MADGTQAKLVSPVIDSIISRLTESKIKKQVEDHLYNIAVNENEIDKETIAER